MGQICRKAKIHRLKKRELAIINGQSLGYYGEAAGGLDWQPTKQTKSNK